MKILNFEAKACERVRQQLDALLSNELTAAAQRECTNHLARCAACAEMFDARQRVKEALKTAVTNSDPASVALRERILNELAQTPPGLQPAWGRSGRRWWLAAAAALLVCAVGFGFLRWSTKPSATLASLPETGVEPNVRLLQIGLRDHVHCALGRDFSAGPPSLAQMAQELGPEFSPLASLVQRHVPSDYAILSAHHCRFAGRSFVHLVLNRQQTRLSLVLTKKNGEAFDQTKVATLVQASGVPLHQMSAQPLHVAGFETSSFLAFVVSGLAPSENVHLATRLAPAVHAWLTQLAG
jgi:anti-sigma factor (TIGR02949 family)